MLIEELKRLINNDTYADAIISAVLDCSRTDYKSTDSISNNEAKLCEEISKDWQKGCALAYERGKWRFLDLPLYITKDVLPPNFATEVIAKAVINRFNGKDAMLELGTGVGCIAIAVAKNTNARITATDISAEALKIAEKNAKLNGVDIEFIQSDMFKSVKGNYDLIMSNPPSSTARALDTLADSGGLIMPRASRDGGDDGLKFIRIIVSKSKEHLKENGILALQLCYDPTGVENIILHDAAFAKQELEYIKDAQGQKKTVFTKLQSNLKEKQNERKSV